MSKEELSEIFSRAATKISNNANSCENREQLDIVRNMFENWIKLVVNKKIEVETESLYKYIEISIEKADKRLFNEEE